MTSILCLAHYCDLHGPTPLMVTEGLSVPCGQCFDDVQQSKRPQTSAVAAASQATILNAMSRISLVPSRGSSAPISEQNANARKTVAPLRRTSSKTSSSSAAAASSATIGSPAQTPPLSPRRAPESLPERGSKAGLRSDSSFRRTYDDYVTKRANPCQNCALTLPKRQDCKESKDQPTKPPGAASDQLDPTLRTRAPYARIYGSQYDASPPNSNPQSSYASDAEEDASPNATIRPSSHRRPTTSTSHSSVSSKSNLSQHTHYLDYTSTHESTVPETFSLVRASCLRTLSFETLPRRPESSQPPSTLPSPVSSIPPSFPSPPIAYGSGYITSTPTPQSASSGGPIFFGDPAAGYTTAYIFRISDVHARGRKRVYAFLALSTHRERLAMKAFSFISAAFRDLATWIQELAELEAERDREREEESSPIAAINAAYRNGGFGTGDPRDSGVRLGLGGGGLSSASMMDRDRDRGEASSFLTGGGRGGGFMQRMGGSMGPGGFAPKARGLAELVGLPDFFIELHKRFVHMLLELGVVLGS